MLRGPVVIVAAVAAGAGLRGPPAAGRLALGAVPVDARHIVTCREQHNDARAPSVRDTYSLAG